MFIWNFLLRITHTIIFQSTADSSWITLYISDDTGNVYKEWYQVLSQRGAAWLAYPWVRPLTQLSRHLPITDRKADHFRKRCVLRRISSDGQSPGPKMARGHLIILILVTELERVAFLCNTSRVFTWIRLLLKWIIWRRPINLRVKTKYSSPCNKPRRPTWGVEV